MPETETGHPASVLPAQGQTGDGKEKALCTLQSCEQLKHFHTRGIDGCITICPGIGY